MKDATFYLLAQLFSILNGNVSGSVYSIEQTPGETDNLFVRITSGFSTKDNNKDNFGSTYVANIDVINRVPRSALSYAELSTLSNEVTQLLNPTVQHNALTENVDFKPVYGRIVDSRDFTDTSDGDYILRRVLTFESRIKQK